MIDSTPRPTASRTSGRLLGRATRAFTPRQATPLAETLAVGLGLAPRHTS